jgi:hypothetical protein
LLDRFAHFPHQFKVVMQIVHGVQLRTQNFFAAVQVV